MVKDYLQRVQPCPCPRRFEESFQTDHENIFLRPPIPIKQLPRSPQRTILWAIEEGLKDLLRPVFVRDMAINATGRIKDEDVRRSVPKSSRAGYGCSPDLIDAGDDWWDLTALIRIKGVKQSLEILKQR